MQLSIHVGPPELEWGAVPKALAICGRRRKGLSQQLQHGNVRGKQVREEGVPQAHCTLRGHCGPDNVTSG